MEKLLAAWERLCASSSVLRFVDINLRGIGQVMLQDNPLTGLLFFLAVAWGSYAAGAPRIAIAGLVAVVVSTLTAQWLRVDRDSLAAGLYGFNGILVGIALATFLAPGPLLWVYVVLGAAGSVVAMLSIANALKTWELPALTFPFVIVTWVLLLATYGFAGLTGTALPAGSVVMPFEPAASNPLRIMDFIQGMSHSVSQVFLKGNGVSALLFLIGLAVNSVPAAVFALVGAFVAVLTAHVFGAESDLITGGLLGFSPVLTAIALGAVFYKPSPRVVVYVVVATVFTAITQSSMNVALTPLAIPALTAPFVLVTWMFLLARPRFDEVPADDAESAKGAGS